MPDPCSRARPGALAVLALIAIASCACDGQEPAKPAAEQGAEQPTTELDALFKSMREGTVEPPPGRPHVILVSLDTLRADHLGAYGYGRETSPFLDRLAGHGALFERVISQSPKTAPSHMSLMTGVYPEFHGGHLTYDEDNREIFHAPDPSLERLAQWFKAAGYRTAAFTGGGQVSVAAGFMHGFERYSERLGDLSDEKLADVWTWLHDHASEPCFLFLHTYQIHDPYIPPRPYDRLFDPDYDGWVVGDRASIRAAGSEFYDKYNAFWGIEEGRTIDVSKFSPRDVEHLRALYDGGIRYADTMLARFFRALAADGILQNSVVVVTSDHGEEFLEHGEFLHSKLFVETVHVPLILFGPGRISPGRRFSWQVELMDVTPTLLELAGLGIPDQVMSRSLVPFLDGDEKTDRAALSEEPWEHGKAHRALRTGRWTLYEHGTEGFLLFDAADDPAEQTDLAGERSARVERLQRLQQELTAERVGGRRPPETTPGVPSEEALEQLRALGYIE